MAAPGKHRITEVPQHVLRRASTIIATGALVGGALAVSAPMAQADDSVWDRVAQCESTGRWSVNSGNGYYGGLQFYQPTWRGYGGQAYAPYAHQATKAEQIAIGKRVVHAQGPGAWPVCSVRAGLTRANGGASPSATPGGSPGASTPAPSAPSAPSAGARVTRYVSASTAANVRSGAGSGYRVVGSVARGEKVTGALSNGWLRIANGRFIGSSVLSSSPVDGRQSSAPSRGSDRGSMAKLVVDGKRGPLTIKAIERWVGTSQNGSLDVATVKGLQRKVGTPADGKWGPKSQAALQRHLGISRDGSSYMNYRTTVALQKYLNANVIK